MKFCLILAADVVSDCEWAGSDTLVPLGLGYIAESVKQALPDVEVIMVETIDQLLNATPDIVGISSGTEHYRVAIDWAQRIKSQLGIPIIIGGIHISLLPQSMKDCFDVGVIGEGEVTVVELLKSFIVANYTFNREILQTINGLVFLDNGKLCFTPPRLPISDLTLLPRIKRENLPYYKKSSTTHVFTARGCPYKCSFCSSTNHFSKYRVQSLERTIEEIEMLITEYDVKEIIFYDDLLIANKKKLQAIIEMLEAKGLIGKCVFSCQVRANLVTEEMCQLLKRLGTKSVGMGVESFCDDVLRYYNKQQVTSEVNQRALDLLAKYEIECSPSFIFGAPIETMDDLLVSLRAIYHNVRENKIRGGGWGLLRPYPGTEIWKYAESIGRVSADMDWSCFDGFANARIDGKLYLGQNIDFDQIIQTINEWRLKFTLAARSPENATGDLFITDVKLLNEIADNLKASYGDMKTLDEGNDLIIDFLKRREQGRIFYLSGSWGNQNEQWFWISSEASMLVYTSKQKQLEFSVVVPELLAEYSILPIELCFKIDGKEQCRQTYTNPGSYDMKFKMPNDNGTIVTISSDKAFVPSNIGAGDDIRELSVILSGLNVL